MGSYEHRLRVVRVSAMKTDSLFFPRGISAPSEKHLYACGSCSILFEAASGVAIRAGVVGACGNCGAANQL
jgi:hypothetical protein